MVLVSAAKDCYAFSNKHVLPIFGLSFETCCLLNMRDEYHDKLIIRYFTLPGPLEVEASQKFLKN